jgi:hypothetical protein
VLVRALAAIGRSDAPLDPAPLITRLARTKDDVLRVALIGALGRLGAPEAVRPLLDLGERALEREDSELLMSVLAALARISPSGLAWKDAKDQEVLPRDAVRAFAVRVARAAQERALEFRTERA